MAQASNTRDQYIIRFPNGMRDEIKEQAKQNCRSINAEIIFLLTRAIQNERPNEKGPAGF